MKDTFVVIWMDKKLNINSNNIIYINITNYNRYNSCVYKYFMFIVKCFAIKKIYH